MGGTEEWHIGPCERCGCGHDACDGNVHPEGPGLHVVHAERPRTRAAVAHGPWSGSRGGSAAGRWAGGGAVDNTGDMAGCSVMDRGSAGASGVAWAIKDSGGST